MISNTSRPVPGRAQAIRAASARGSPRKSARAGTNCERSLLLSREKRLLELAEGLRRSEQDLAADLPADRLERAGNLERQEIVEGLRAAEVRELEEIHAALKRLDAGTYGICERCQNPIDALRLHALPATRSCTHCVGAP